MCMVHSLRRVSDKKSWRNGCGRVPDASHAIDFEETDASRTRPEPFLPGGSGGTGHMESPPPPPRPRVTNGGPCGRAGHAPRCACAAAGGLD
eukprot:gene12850-biopygen12511